MVLIIICCLLATLLLPPAAAQESDVARQTDSILALLPHLPDSARIDALLKIENMHEGLLSRGRILQMTLNEARRQGNIRVEGMTLTRLASFYYNQSDCDSVSIFGEEAIRFNRQHKRYEDMFSAYDILIRYDDLQGRTISAMRRADEALAEAR